MRVKVRVAVDLDGDFEGPDVLAVEAKLREGLREGLEARGYHVQKLGIHVRPTRPWEPWNPKR